MPWFKVDPMDAKVLFLSDWLRGGDTFTALCQRHGISRKTGYKWVRRYRELGLDGLKDRSRKPLHFPNRIAYTIRKEIVALRRQYPHWGPKKILQLMATLHSDWVLPSTTSVYNILRAEGLIKRRRRKRRVAPSPMPFSPVHQPNEVWTADFKGQFYTKDGTCCYPLTVMDYKSRYLLDCRIIDGTRCKETRRVFESLFTKYGLPGRIRTDNGVPFASIAVGGLSRLSAWWIRLGILPERIEPGKPQQNGRHERMHRTLKQETLRPPAPNAKAQQSRFDSFRNRYNNIRPHEGLNQQTPASCYSGSDRPFPSSLPEFQYPGHFKRARVNHNGAVWLNGTYVYLSYLLRGETVGLEQLDSDLWAVHFDFLPLCRIKNYVKEPYDRKGNANKCYPCL
jgi:transposase InsO family protein